MPNYNNKIVIGSANFGQHYGYANTNTSEKEIKKIFKFAIMNNINHLDTAINYGNAQKLLGMHNLEMWNIDTKIPKVPFKVKEITSWLEKNLENTLRDLNVTKLNTIYFHEPKDLLGPQAIYIIEYLNKLKENKTINNIGISVYYPSELEKILSIFKPDIVQIPYSIFDRRFENQNSIKILKKNKIKIYARSIFLQGLVLLRQENLPLKFNKYKALWKEYEEWLNYKNLDKLQTAIRFAFGNNDIDKVIIGVENVVQLTEIVKIKKNKINIPNFKSKIDNFLVVPSNWNK